MTRKIKSSDFLDEIISIEDVGLHQTYDFTIPGTHCFFANGFLVHNCGSIEELSDEVFLCYQEEPKAGAIISNSGNYVMELAKNRFGPTGEFYLDFQKPYFRFA